jgi:hypothetical protein
VLGLLTLWYKVNEWSPCQCHAHFVEVDVDPAKESAAKRFWPVWVAVGMPLLLIVLNSTRIGTDFVFVMMGVPVLLGAWVCLSIWALVICVQRMWHREWSLAVVSAILPLVVLGSGMQVSGFIHSCNYGGDVLYFMSSRSSYLEEINATRQDGKPRLLVFDRGGMVWASRGYVYDESDEVIRAETLRSTGWKTRADETELGCGYFAEPFPGHLSFTKHWYIASFNC